MNTPIIFDLDGTLIDSKPEIIATYQKVFKHLPPDTKKNVTELDFGQTLMTLLSGLYTDGAKKRNARRLFLDLYDTSDFEDTPLYDGVLDILNYLKDKNYSLFIATNKRLAPTRSILKLKGIHTYFKEVVANEMKPGVVQTKPEMLRYLKEKYKMETAYMIGDTHVDLSAAKSVDFKTIAVLYGYESPDSLLKMNPNYTISSLSELKKWF